MKRIATVAVLVLSIGFAAPAAVTDDAELDVEDVADAIAEATVSIPYQTSSDDSITTSSATSVIRVIVVVAASLEAVDRIFTLATKWWDHLVSLFADQPEAQANLEAIAQCDRVGDPTPLRDSMYLVVCAMPIGAATDR